VAHVICRNDPLVILRVGGPEDNPYAPPYRREQETRRSPAERASLATFYVNIGAFGLALIAAVLSHFEAVPVERRQELLQLSNQLGAWALLLSILSYPASRLYLWLTGSENTAGNHHS